MQSNLTNRFIECVELVKKENNIPSFRKLSKVTNIHHQCFSDLSRGLREVSLDMVLKLADSFDVDANYILSGKGTPLLKTEESPSNIPQNVSPVIAVVTDNTGKERIAHVPYSAQAGYTDQFLETEYLKELPSFTLPDPRFSSGTYRAFDVSGDSMEPLLYSGEMVVCEFVEQENWIGSIRNNFVYVLVTNSGIVVKRVLNRISKTQEIVLVSDNSFYEDYVLPVSDLKEVWKLTHKISPFMPSPSNIRNGLHQEVEGLRTTISEQGRIIQSLNTTIEKLLKQNRQVSARY